MEPSDLVRINAEKGPIWKISLFNIWTKEVHNKSLSEFISYLNIFPHTRSVRDEAQDFLLVSRLLDQAFDTGKNYRSAELASAIEIKEI